MVSKEGYGTFYKGLVPLWGRQIPYTMMKFSCFEKTVEILYKVSIKRLAYNLFKNGTLIFYFIKVPAGYDGRSSVCPRIEFRINS